MTIAEKLILEGMMEGLEIAVKNSIIKGLTTEEIVEITGFGHEQIENIRNNMLYEVEDNIYSNTKI